MIRQELSQELIEQLSTTSGHINGIVKMLKSDGDPVGIFIQMKACENSFNKALLLLLEEVFRKAMAEKIVLSREICPGNCGYENDITRLLKEFPGLKPEEIPYKLAEIQKIEDHLQNLMKKS